MSDASEMVACPNCGEIRRVERRDSPIGNFKFFCPCNEPGNPWFNAPEAQKSEKTETYLGSIWKRFKLRMMEPREYWKERARAVNEKANVGAYWSVGRTDMISFDGEGGVVHYAYPPDEGTERVPFYGDCVTALRAAVKFAEAMNANLG